jgi:hypothetical protein
MKVIQYDNRDYTKRAWDSAPSYNMFALVKNNVVHRSYTTETWKDLDWSKRDVSWLNTFRLELIY